MTAQIIDFGPLSWGAALNYTANSAVASSYQSVTGNAYIQALPSWSKLGGFLRFSQSAPGQIAGQIDMAVEDPNGPLTPDWKNVLFFTEQGSSVQTAFQGASFQNQATLPFLRCRLIAKSTSAGTTTFSSITAKMIADLLNG